MEGLKRTVAMTLSTFPGEKSVATPARSSRSTIKLLELLVCLAFVTSSLRWFTVLSYGSVSIEPVHVALVFLTLYFCFSLRALSEVSFLLSYAPLFWVLYTLYLLLSVPLLLRKGFNPAIVNLLPQLLYVPAFFAIYLCLFKTALGQSSFKCYLGAGLAIIVFVLTLGVSAAIGGADLQAAWSGLVNGGSFYTFNRMFTKIIFGGSGFQSPKSSTEFIEYSNAIKNELASCMVVLYSIMRSLRTFRPRWWSRVLEIACFCIVGFVVVLSFSRSAFLCLTLALFVSFAISLLANRSSIDRAFLMGIGFAVAAAVVALLSSVGPVLLASFEDSISYEERLRQFSVAAQLIEANIWFGTGANVEVNGHDIHNLFLATWAKSGLFPFLAVLSAYFLLLATWVVTFVRTVTVRSSWRLPNDPGWVCAIAIVPLTRVYLSGKGGTFSISMWLGTVAFLAFVVANRAAIARAIGGESGPQEPTDKHV